MHRAIWRSIQGGFTGFRHLLQQWSDDFWRSLSGPTGYKYVGAIIALYVFFYQVQYNRYERDFFIAEAAFSDFLNLSATGNPSVFWVNMLSFGDIQNREVLKEPSIFRFWEWDDAEIPFYYRSSRWMVAQSKACTQETCGTPSGARMALMDVSWSKVYVALADFHGADFTNSVILSSDLRLVDFSGAKIKNAQWEGVDVTGADFSGAEVTCSWLRNLKSDSFDDDSALKFHDSHFRGVDLSGSEVRVEIVGSEFSEADCEDKVLEIGKDRISLTTEPSFYGATVTGVIENSSLRNANLIKADFSKTVFKNVDISGAHFDEDTKWPDGVDPRAGTILSSHQAPTGSNVELGTPSSSPAL